MSNIQKLIKPKQTWVEGIGQDQLTKKNNQIFSDSDSKLLTLLKKWTSSFTEIIPEQHKNIQLSLCCLLTGHHCLMEGPTGQGKTTFIKQIAASVDLSFGRIQGTQDLLPSDLLGFMAPVMDEQKVNRWELRPGAVVCDFLMVDEINRLSARTQSGLLQSMEEKAFTIERVTTALDHYFTVFATQNPQEYLGVTALTESQVDRFAVKCSLEDYSNESLKKLLLSDFQISEPKQALHILSKEELSQLRLLVPKVSLSQWLMDWMIFIYQASQTSHAQTFGLEDSSPLSLRFLRQWVSLVKAYAFIQGRFQVIASDVEELLYDTASHRLFQQQTLPISTLKQKTKDWFHSLL